MFFFLLLLAFVNVELLSLQVAVYSCARTRGSERFDGAVCMDFLQNICQT